MELIDKDTLVAEINKLKECFVNKRDDFEKGYHSSLNEVSNFINTLEVKEVDLEEEIESSMNNLCEPGCYIQLLLENPRDYERFAKPFSKENQ